MKLKLTRLWLIYGLLIVLFFIIEELYLGVQVKNSPYTWPLSFTWLVIPIFYIFYTAARPGKPK